MLVGVKHKIDDPQKFWGAAQESIPNAPEGMRLIQAFPNKEMNSAICLWESPSVQALKDFVEPQVSDISDNEYFEVNTENAIGLPG